MCWNNKMDLEPSVEYDLEEPLLKVNPRRFVLSYIERERQGEIGKKIWQLYTMLILIQQAQSYI